MIKVRMKVGGSTYPFPGKIAYHDEAEVVDITEAGEVTRVLDKLEWEPLFNATEAVVEPSIEIVPAVEIKPAPENIENKQSAIPDETTNSSLEDVDVSAL